MLEKFFPGFTTEKVQDIDLDLLRSHNIKGLILDIDNTLVPNHVKDADENVIRWIERIKNSGFKVCIVSNASKKRVVRFNERLKLYAIHRASKPGTAAFKKAQKLMGIEPGETAVVGDQIFTDVFGGNRAGMYTILVKPIDRREQPLTRVKRVAEGFVLSKFRKRKLKVSK
ncbi:MAG: YqeG family HAD IIIA-type phosphatase [Clostridiales bacterium]|jgi:HAD superfamily phosphatase (TIGR01668 family)|nr:YqeG family HAD IIIA-type phosphatase [Eubacteriales bacterium]MDH7565263.1 YqeG family HAD IIIA-type phosphatase [Clostridiales bacterium]